MSESTKNPAVEKPAFRWVMLILVMLVYIIVLGFTNQSFNILLGTIVGEEGWSAAQKTAVSGAMALGMVWFCFIAGSAIDKISVKKVMGTALVLLAALIFFRGQAHGFVIWYATMFLYGVVSAFYQPCVTKTVSLWFDKDELSFANGCKPHRPGNGKSVRRQNREQPQRRLASAVCYRRHPCVYPDGCVVDGCAEPQQHGRSSLLFTDSGKQVLAEHPRGSERSLRLVHDYCGRRFPWFHLCRRNLWRLCPPE
jgi:hypothetical protein